MDERLNEYQYVIDGVTMPLSALTHEQALYAIADMIDVIEKIDEALYEESKPLKIIRDWRYDENIKPIK